MSVSRDQRHSKRSPCPVCGGADQDPRGIGKRCEGFTSADGDWCHCARTELAGAIEQNNAGLFAHLMHGPCKCGAEHGPPRVIEPEATYDYLDEGGTLIFQVVRKPGNKFLQRAPDGKGGWIWKTAGIRMVPYRLPQLIAADPTTMVWIVEGEKDADTGARAGLLTTCNPRGAGKWSAVADLAKSVLAGRNITIVADNDKPGRDHAAQVADSLRSVASSVRVVKAPAAKDLAAHLSAGGNILELVDLPIVDKDFDERTTAALKAQIAAEGSMPELPFDGEDVADDPALRPIVRLSTELHNVITESCNALSNDRNVFARDHALVDVIRCAESDADTYIAVGAPKIRPMAVATMRERLTRCALFEKKDGRRKDGFSPTIPPDNVVSGVMSRGEYPGIRPIIGILEAPSIRPDGSVIQEPGYDLRTGYLYEPSGIFTEVPDKPSQKDATLALRELFEVFADFPFAIEAGRSAAVAGLLTILARPAIDGAVPAFIVDASTRGTGKSLTTDVIGIIATGRATAKMSWPADDVELEKVLGAYAMRGSAVINFDNVVRAFGGGPLDRCLTAVDTVELRILGKSEVPAVLWRAVVLATGNNVALTGDTSRRSLIIRLESLLEHPEDRTDFKHMELVNWCRENRPRLVVAALTVLRAWFVAGKPDMGCKRWGSFEAWSGMVPQAIVFAGGADPLDARPAVTDQEEPEKAALIGIIAGLRRFDADGNGITIRTLLETLYPTRRDKDGPPDGWNDFRESIEGLVWTKAGTSPTPRAVATAFRKVRRRFVGGYCLDSRTITDGYASWFVNSPGGNTGRHGRIRKPEPKPNEANGHAGVAMPASNTTETPPEMRDTFWEGSDDISDASPDVPDQDPHT